jgi:hypothetical protein
VEQLVEDTTLALPLEADVAVEEELLQLLQLERKDTMVVMEALMVIIQVEVVEVLLVLDQTQRELVEMEVLLLHI